MITTFIFIVFGFFIGFFIIEYDGFISILIKILFGSLVACLGAMIGITVAMCFPMEKTVVVDTINIVNLKDNSKTSGSFFIGSGVIKDEMKYVFYYSEKNDSGETVHKMKQIPYDKTDIIFSDTLKQVKVYRKEPVKEAIINYFALDLDVFDEYKYVIYVPEGTIKQEYVLDAQ